MKTDVWFFGNFVLTHPPTISGETIIIIFFFTLTFLIAPNTEFVLDVTAFSSTCFYSIIISYFNGC